MLETLSRVPSKPGVYLFKDAQQRVLYVGKAKDLKNRLKSYVQKSSRLDNRKTAMIRAVKDYAYIVTSNELEALVLEANFIKQYKPKFNVILRDDKNYPYLKLTVNEEWPRLEVVRKTKRDGALYFGPYVPTGSMREALTFIRQTFKIRDCRYSLDRKRRPCIQYQMGKCLAPCSGHADRESYKKIVDEIKLFLSGKNTYLISSLEKKMKQLSDDMEFEEAAKIRDRVKALEKARESQKIIAPKLGDTDVIGFYREKSTISFEIFFIRNGIMISSKVLFMKNNENVSDSELMYTFLIQFYSKEIIPPSQILLSVLPKEAQSLQQWLSKRKGSSVKIMAPKTGRKQELVHMALENALFAYRNKKEPELHILMRDLQERLHLQKTPEDIGAFDVSTISGKESVGAFICWSQGAFQKDKYRRLKIKTVQGMNDYSMTKEIIQRTITNLDGNLPDLVVIDGGIGQLKIAEKVIDMNREQLKTRPSLIAIAKDPDRAFRTTSDIPPITLDDRRQSSLLLKRIRDEAHRFAIEYHKKLREKRILQSPLEAIPGIGKKRRFELLRVFGSIEGIRNASLDEIAHLKGFNEKIAERLLRSLRRSS
jgi:excinuclease ABC subunit C